MFKLLSLTILKVRSLHVRRFFQRFSNTQVCAGVFIIENSEMSRCDQSSMIDCNDLLQALVFEVDVQLSRLLQSDGAQAGDESGPAVAEAVANLVDDTELSEVSTDEVELSDSNGHDFLPTAGNIFSSDEGFAAPR